MDTTNHIQSIQAGKINQLINRFTQAMNNYSAKDLADCFTADAAFTNVAGRLWQGLTEIEKAHAPLFAPQQIPGVPSFHGSVFEVTEASVRFIKPDVVTADIHWQQTGTKGPNGEPWPLRKGLLNATAVQNYGEWLFVVSHNMIIA